MPETHVKEYDAYGDKFNVSTKMHNIWKYEFSNEDYTVINLKLFWQ